MTKITCGAASDGLKAIVVALIVVFGGEALAQKPAAPSALDFATSASQSDQFEIQTARIVLAQSQDPRVRAFAQQMIADHSQMADSLRQAAMTSGLVLPPPSMTSDQAMTLMALQTSADLDKDYIRQQVLAHHQALAVQQSYAETGRDENLVRLATSEMAVVKRHLQTVEQIRGTLPAK